MQIIKHKKNYLIASLIMVVVSLVLVAVFGLNLSTEFIGGSVFKYNLVNQELTQDAALERVNTVFAENDVSVSSRYFDEDTLIVRTAPVDSQKNDLLLVSLGENFDQLLFETTGSAIGSETLRRALIALLVAFGGIMIYISFAFRNVPSGYSSFRFAVVAIVAMMHDVIIVLGIFAALGYFLNVQIDLLFITAILTVIGFSVNDTIVVFDRIRENLIRHPKKFSFAELVNKSIVETLRRSIGTSLTVAVVLGSLFLFGGTSIKYFSLAMLLGVLVGTYSSIFLASPLLLIWHTRSLKK